MLKVNKSPFRRKFLLKPRIHDKQIVVSPCFQEHWISTDLFKFRIYAERNHLHVIGGCSANQIPMFSLFCDELWIIEAEAQWYERSSWNNTLVDSEVRHADYKDIERGELRSIFKRIPDAEVIERFRKRKVHVVKSFYDEFFKLDLPRDLIVCEIKYESQLARQKMASLNLPMVVGIDYQFQKDLIARVGQDNYMTTQILASKFLNWQFFCVAGSSNLFSVIPTKVLFLADETIDDSVQNIVNGLTVRYPIFSPISSWPEYKVDESFINATALTEAFKDLSTQDIGCEIALIGDK